MLRKGFVDTHRHELNNFYQYFKFNKGLDFYDSSFILRFCSVILSMKYTISEILL